MPNHDITDPLGQLGPVPATATWVGPRPLVILYGEVGFESRRKHECLSLVNVCCQVELSANG